MLDPLPPYYAPDEVLRLRDLRWGLKKRRNARSPTMGRDATWAQMIAMFEGVVIDTLSRLGKQDWSQLELIGARRVIDYALRCASEPPSFYAGPLYVSGGQLNAIARWQRSLGEGLTEKKPAGIVEHVLPLATFASGTRILRDPATHLPDVRRAILGPVCSVTKDENARLDRKGNANPILPFGRYTGITDVYRTIDGERIDAAIWSFDDHLALMASVPAFATGAALMIDGATYWRDTLVRTGYRGHVVESD